LILFCLILRFVWLLTCWLPIRLLLMCGRHRAAFPSLIFIGASCEGRGCLDPGFACARICKLL
jgi:hypothetical protein